MRSVECARDAIGVSRVSASERCAQHPHLVDRGYPRYLISFRVLSGSFRQPRFPTQLSACGCAMAVAGDATDPPRCTHVIVKRGKTKTCRQYAKPGTSPPVCGNHLATSGGGDRVPCDHCGTHVLRREMAKHVGKCPAYLRVAEAESMPYFARDVNLGSDDEDEATTAAGADEPTTRLPRSEELRALVARVRRACADAGVVPKIPTPEPMSDARCEAAVARLSEAAKRASGGGGGVGKGQATRIAPFNPRHASQQASIVSHMAALGLVRDRTADVADAKPPVYVELGAGRGYLSHFLVDAYGPNDLVLVERRAYRFKAERNIRGGGEEVGTSGDGSAPASSSPGTKVERLRVDIKDLRMSGVAAVDGRDAVITGKHLCGSATDLALRCCLADTNGRDGDEPSSASSTCRVTGVALATCCHHRCEWRSYVNKPFMRKLGFARDDFPRLARMSSWACDGAAPGVGSVKRPRSFAGEEPTTADATEAADEHGQPPVEDVDDGDMSKAEKYEIGGMVKTLIDVGRVEWLQRRGLHGRLVGYVDTEVSPENRLIVVSRGERS